METPEGVRLELRPAGPVPRALAFAIDATLRSTAYVMALMPLAVTAPELSVAAGLVLMFLGEWFYPVLFEVRFDGRTPGKRAVGLRVLRGDGTPVDLGASLLRNLLLYADFLPGAYLAGLAAMLAHPSFRRLGDLAADTLVVHVSSEAAAAEAPAEARPLPPPLPLTEAEQRAVVAFGERLGHLAPARAEELARLAAPLCAEGTAAVPRLLGIGAWLRGRRPPSEADEPGAAP